MIIDLASVGTTAKRIETEFDPSEIDLEGEPVQLRGNTELFGEIVLVDAKAQLSGTVKAHLVLDCTRCLDVIERDLELPFRAIFVDSSGDDPNVEAEVSEDALDESLVPDGHVNMAEVVREQLLLWLPEQIFCRDDCRGLCPKCGANLNLIDCKCADEDVDPRWAALKSLKKA
ncbi:MAG TPA: DUF177 domain-containing protein [Pyrinomonadaceae bacterium]|nr:DUF177 domain-containing protein [Acidobacteriota bacterium]HQZ96792.1 DUF177 domain-containing protein [Pyrinomonadaceae bacterium]